MTLPGQIQIDVGFPGQDRSFVTLEVVRTHVRMQVAPVIVGSSRVVVATAFVWGIVITTNRSHIRGKGRSLDARETGHAGELLS